MKKAIFTLSSALLLVACQPAQVEEIEVEPVQALIDDQIVVDSPYMNSHIETPVIVHGEARGTWFFEASFPVTLVDSEGNILAEAPTETPDSWMTEDFIQFGVELEFEETGGEGEIVLKKDNPSGLEEFDAELRIPVTY